MGSDLGMLLVKAIVLGMVVTGVLGFFLYRYLSSTTESHITHLNHETEEVRKKQVELTDKIKLANEELNTRRAEADQLVAKMKDEAAEKAQIEREKIITKARTDGEDIINKAQKTKEDIRKALEAEMDLKAMDFSVLVLKRVLGEKSLVALHDSLIADFLEGIKDLDMSVLSKEIMSAEVTLALPTDDQLKNQLASLLAEKMGRKITLNYSEDRKLVAGLVLRFESLTINGCMTNYLKDKGTELKEQLEKGLLSMEDLQAEIA